MKYFYIYYKNGSVSRGMFVDIDSANKFYLSLGLISKISFIEEIV